VVIDISRFLSGHDVRGAGQYVNLLYQSLEKFHGTHEIILLSDTRKFPSCVDLVHYPYFDPFFLTYQQPQSIPTVVTVHDLIPLLFPKQFPRGIRGSIKWLMQKHFLRHTRRIITDSQCSKRDIERIVCYPKDRIDVVYLASNPRLLPFSQKREEIYQKYRIPKRFILYVGDVNWNKNIMGLIRSYALLPLGRPYLVLVGKAFLDTKLDQTHQIDTLIQNLGLGSSILKTGYVTDLDLGELYGAAQLLVLPSHYEGFGFPVLEAFLCGCPVVISKNSSLDEIGGPAVRVSSNDCASIAKGMAEVLSFTASKRRDIIAQGRQWVKRFSWETVARETIQIYEKASKRI